MNKRIVLLQALATLPSNLTLMVKDVAPQAFRRRGDLGAWGMADTLSHLIAVEAQYWRRLQTVLVEERPFLPAILPDPTTHNLQAPAAELLAQFGAARRKTLAFLKDVTDDGWRRTAVHETQGEVTFHYLVQYLVDHDSEHLNQIMAIQQRLNTQF